MRSGVACLLLACVMLALPHNALAQTEIRVVLSDSATAATIAGNVNWTTADGKTGASNDLANVKLASGGVTLDTLKFKTGSSRLTATPVSGYIRYSGREYRGRFEFFTGKSGGLVVLNVLPLEDYLLGVVPGEMPAGWPPEALKAQAVAARTYALSRMMANQDASYDVYSTVADQVYGGVGSEDARTTAAVRQTTGQIVTYDGVPITAYFCSDAGGYTRQGSLPYLQSVPSFAPESPNNDWQVELNADKLAQIAAGVWQGIGKLTRIEAANDPVSGHLTSLLLIGEKGRVKLNPVNLRKVIGYDVMKSTRARIYAAGDAAAAPPFSTTAPPYSTAAPTSAAGAIVPVVTIDPFPKPGHRELPGEIKIGTTEIFDYARPSVRDAERSYDIKLRRLYAYNGVDLRPCVLSFNATNMDDVSAEPIEAPPGESPAQPTTQFPTTTTTPPTAMPPQAAYDETDIDLNGGGIVIRGSGYGHGMGMSQYGARTMAATGSNYVDILKYFYTGVEVVDWSGEVPAPPAGDSSSFYEPFTQGQ